MKKDYTHISILLDKSGSMYPIKSDVIGCLNEFIEEQKKVKGILTVSFSTFNEFYSELNSFTDLTAFEPLTERSYRCTGGTALLDSFAKVIDDTGTYLSKLDDSEKPEKVLIVVITDGEENSSIEISSEVLKEKVEHQKAKYNWQFIYLGANQDAFSVGQSIGVNGANYSTDKIGIRKLFKAHSKSFTSYRGADVSGATFNLSSQDIENEDLS